MARHVLKVRRNSTKNNKLHLANKTAEDIIFAHESEKEFARILDFYKIKWEYEPKTFTLEWDEDNIPKKSFTPDFYLPDLDLYIELTTLNQKLVTKKNGKIKKLREMYPDINVKLFYKKDYNSLLFKYINK
jgi:hypoxanthine phosphoribosyltransferase